MSAEAISIQSETRRAGCFLCEPDPSLVFARTQNFFAMLGHGPIGEGYSLIASVLHEPSMLDLTVAMAQEAEEFTNVVRERLAPLYGPSIATEHGRVAPCIAMATDAYEPHCLHAHRLVFPGWDHLEVRALAPQFRWHKHASFLAAHGDKPPAGQYLACQQVDGTIEMADAPTRVPRQFFRTIVAAAAGCPELADWHRTRGDRQIDAARQRLEIA